MTSRPDIEPGGSSLTNHKRSNDTDDIQESQHKRLRSDNEATESSDTMADDTAEEVIPRRDKGKGRMKYLPVLPGEVWRRIWSIYYYDCAEYWHRVQAHNGALLPLLISPDLFPDALSMLYGHPLVTHETLDSFLLALRQGSSYIPVRLPSLVHRLTIKASPSFTPRESAFICMIHPSLPDLFDRLTNVTSLTIKDTLVNNGAEARLLFQALRRIRPRRLRLEIRMWDLSEVPFGQDIIAATQQSIHTTIIHRQSGGSTMSGRDGNANTWRQHMQSAWLDALWSGRLLDLPPAWIDPPPPKVGPITANLAQNAANLPQFTMSQMMNIVAGGNPPNNHPALAGVDLASEMQALLGDDDDDDDVNADTDSDLDLDDDLNTSNAAIQGSDSNNTASHSAPITLLQFLQDDASGNSSNAPRPRTANHPSETPVQQPRLRLFMGSRSQTTPASVTEEPDDPVHFIRAPSPSPIHPPADPDPDNLPVMSVIAQSLWQRAKLGDRFAARLLKLDMPDFDVRAALFRAGVEIEDNYEGNEDEDGQDLLASMGEGTVERLLSAERMKALDTGGQGSANDLQAQVEAELLEQAKDKEAYARKGLQAVEREITSVRNERSSLPIPDQVDIDRYIRRQEHLLVEENVLQKQAALLRKQLSDLSEPSPAQSVTATASSQVAPAPAPIPEPNEHHVEPIFYVVPPTGRRKQTARKSGTSNRLFVKWPADRASSSTARPAPAPPAFGESLGSLQSHDLAHEMRAVLLQLLQEWEPDILAFSFVAMDPLASLIVRSPRLDFWTRVAVPHIRVHLPRGVSSLAVFKSAAECAIDRQRARDAGSPTVSEEISWVGQQFDMNREVGGDGMGGDLVHEAVRLFEIEVNTIKEMGDVMWERAGGQLPAVLCRVLVGEHGWEEARVASGSTGSPVGTDVPLIADQASLDDCSDSIDFDSDMDAGEGSDDELIDEDAPGETFDASAAEAQAKRIRRRLEQEQEQME